MYNGIRSSRKEENAYKYVPLTPSQKSSIILLSDSGSSPPNYDEATDVDDYDIVNEYNRIPHENRNLAYYIAWPVLFIRSNLWTIERSFPGLPVLFKLLCWKVSWIFTIVALYVNHDNGIVLLGINSTLAFFYLWDWFMEQFQNSMQSSASRLTIAFGNCVPVRHLHFLVAGIGFLAPTAFVIYDVFFYGERVKTLNLVAIGGLLFYIIFCIILSAAPHKVQWRPVIWGLCLQFLIGLVVLRTTIGYIICSWFSERVQYFLSYADAGALFLCGGAQGDISSFLFGVLPIIIYFSMIINMLYYIGLMQYLIQKVSWLMEVTCGTSAPESMTCAGNIFVGIAESPLLIRPYIEYLTQSEIFCVMVSGFASIAGSVFGAYLKMGIGAPDLITACFMSAPGALVVSKLIYPEIQKSKFAGKSPKRVELVRANNIVEAACKGASDAIPVVANIAVMLVAFVSLIECMNDTLKWLGQSVGHDDLSLDLLLGYVFYPFVYVLGIEQPEVIGAASLVGQKTFFTEFIAYQSLSNMVANRIDGLPRCDCEGNIRWFSERTQSIITYALCGFSNLPTTGIMLGTMIGLAPTRQKTFTKLLFRALIGGIVACMIRACIASILFAPSGDDFKWGENTTLTGCRFVWNDEMQNYCNVECPNGEGEFVWHASPHKCDVYSSDDIIGIGGNAVYSDYIDEERPNGSDVVYMGYDSDYSPSIYDQVA